MILSPLEPPFSSSLLSRSWYVIGFLHDDDFSKLTTSDPWEILGVSGLSGNVSPLCVLECQHALGLLSEPQT